MAKKKPTPIVEEPVPLPPIEEPAPPPEPEPEPEPELLAQTNRCESCHAIVTDEQAAKRLFNVGLCHCGGTLVPFEVPTMPDPPALKPMSARGAHDE